MKLLYIKNLASKTIGSFERSAFIAAREAGLEITFACNTSNIDPQKMEQDCQKYGVKLVHIDFERNPFSFKNIKAYKQLLTLMLQNHYDICHCNTPMGGVIGRLAAHKATIPYVIYQAHGFHFWKGAPLFNWLCYYPVERLLAHYTDLLITINQEDYQAAQKFSAKKVILINGVGIDTSLFSSDTNNNLILRDKLGILKEAFVLLSVGELIKRKNNIAVIEALGYLKNYNITYVLCGEGPKKQELYKRAQKLGISKQVIFAGFQHNIKEFYQMSDAFILSSFQEGVPAVTMEAMACKIPVLASRIRGHIDLLPNSKLLFSPNNPTEIVKCIKNVLEHKPKQEIERNIKHLEKFSFIKIVEDMKTIYIQAKENAK